MKTFLYCLAICGALRAAMPVLEDLPKYDSAGYDNCNMLANGELQLLADMSQSKVIFDVGANKGEWSRQALNAAPKAKIYAFEPVPQIFTQLSETLKSTTVTLVNAALSADGQKEKTIHFYPKESGMSTLYKRNSVRLASKPVHIQTMRLDDYCKENNINQIDFLKIDTEGSEWDVIQGASSYFTDRKIAAVQFEYGGTYQDAKITLEQIYRYLTAAGYEIFRISSSGLIPIREWKPSLENYRYSNYLARLPQAGL